MSLSIFIRSPNTFSERKFPSSLTINALKAKLEHITGIPYVSQVLEVYATADAAERGEGGEQLDDGERTLGEVVKEWQCISVTNVNPHVNPEGEFTDVSRVDKYEISNEEYEKRNDTVLQDLKARRLGRFAPPTSTSPPPTHRATAEQMPGKRCIVLHPGGSTTTTKPVGDEPRGTIEFVGKTGFGRGKAGEEVGDWVGVRLDEPVGKNDGSVEGERYFTCQANHGVFVRPDRVVVGDWPEVDEFADMADEDEI